MSTNFAQQLFSTAQAQLASELVLTNSLLASAVDTAAKLNKLHVGAGQALLARNLAPQAACNQHGNLAWWQDPSLAEANLIAAFNWFQEAGNIAFAAQAEQARLVQSQLSQLSGQANAAAQSEQAVPMQQLVGQAIDLANTGYAQMMQASGELAHLIKNRVDALAKAPAAL